MAHARTTVNIRMAPATHAQIKRAADNAGLSVAAFMREAALMRAAIDHAQAQRPGTDAELIQLVRDYLAAQ